MGTYKNDYSKNEDSALWELHEVRNVIAKRKLSFTKLNEQAIEIIKKYNLKNLKIWNEQKNINLK